MDLRTLTGRLRFRATESTNLNDTVAASRLVTGRSEAADQGALFDSHWVGKVEFASSTPTQACDLVIGLARQGRARHVHLANAYTVALADSPGSYRDALAAPAINFPDRKPIGWVSSLRGQKPGLHQVRGTELFRNVLDQGRTHELRHYLLGSTPEVLELLEREIRSRFPGISIVGVGSPPFRRLTSHERRDQDQAIRDSGAQIVWVGLGTPKQDHEARRLVENLPIVAVAVGAAFDFAAGTRREAPRCIVATGLEWAFRFAIEPRRLWRRYVFGNARFIYAVLRGDR